MSEATPSFAPIPGTFTPKLGALPPTPAKPRLRLMPFLTGVTPQPTPADWLSKVSQWPMYGNDAYGDCVWAAIGHEVEAFSTYGQGAIVELSLESLLKGYSDVTGFKKDDPSTDQGTVIQDALNYWRKTGVGGHQILAFAEVDVSNPEEVDAAIDLFGAVQIGFTVYKFVMDQFRNHQPWDDVPIASRGALEGGHCVHVGKTDGNGNRTCTTWGRTQLITSAFWKNYVTEAWVVITPEWFDLHTRKDPTGLDLYGLGAAMSALTGEPNPFKPPTPPAPTPTPTPAPVTQSDIDFAHEAHTFLNSKPYFYRHFQSHLKTWLSTKGL